MPNSVREQVPYESGDLGCIAEHHDGLGGGHDPGAVVGAGCCNLGLDDRVEIHRAEGPAGGTGIDTGKEEEVVDQNLHRGHVEQRAAGGRREIGVGAHRALPGIVMPAAPTVTGIGYRQEFFAGEAEDMGQVIAVSGEATVPAGTFSDVVVTRDWTPLDPDTVEEKTYSRGVGFVHETKRVGPDAGEIVELIDFTPGG